MTEAGPATLGRDRPRPAWAIFLALTAGIVIVDQLTKAWVVANVPPGGSISLLGDLLRLVVSRNTGALFGLFGASAPIFAAASLGVMALIVGYHARSGRSLVLSLALGLLLGGACGNLIDRVRLGYVVDFVDMGIGALRFWTYNVSDASIDVALLLLLLLAFRPSLAGRSTGG